jgi:hypothetical protein
MAHIASDGKVVITIKQDSVITNDEYTNIYFTYSFSDGMLELH